MKSERRSFGNCQASATFAQARAYVSTYPVDRAESERGVYPAEVLPLLDEGVIVLHQRCPHLGCRVPFCESSQWFECPCHAAKFDRAASTAPGPSPRGMALVRASIENGRLIVSTDTTISGLPIGTNTTHQAAEGPACVG